jgi:hypothetical protein
MTNHEHNITQKSELYPFGGYAVPCWACAHKHPLPFGECGHTHGCSGCEIYPYIFSPQYPFNSHQHGGYPKCPSFVPDLAKIKPHYESLLDQAREIGKLIDAVEKGVDAE